MEELKNTPSAQAAEKKDGRKPYVAPTADIILLAPKEELSAWDYGYDGGDRWAIGKWGGFNSETCAASGATGGLTGPNSWTMPEIPADN